MPTSSNDFSSSEENADAIIQGPEEDGVPPFSDFSEEEKIAEGELPGSTLPSEIASLPPEAQGEANGGPLGCCLGITVGILLSLAIAVISRIYPAFFITIFGQQLSIFTRILMTLALMIGAIIFGTTGWRIGKRFYREYEPSPRYLRKMAQLEERQRKIEQRRRRRPRIEKNISK